MEINDNTHRTEKSLRIQQPSHTEKQTPLRRNTPGTDDVDISSRAREAMRIMDAVKKAPDVREGLVLRVREAIESGTFQVDGTEVAKELIRQSILDSIT